MTGCFDNTSERSHLYSLHLQACCLGLLLAKSDALTMIVTFMLMRVSIMAMTFMLVRVSIMAMVFMVVRVSIMIVTFIMCMAFMVMMMSVTTMCMSIMLFVRMRLVLMGMVVRAYIFMATCCQAKRCTETYHRP